MAKRPKDSPTEEGQRVILRGRGHLGTITKIDDRDWVWVDWDEPKTGAKICHANELQFSPNGGHHGSNGKRL